ncbi:NADH-quinone oxidoreductase subunit N [Paenibacillus sp. GSMTC-2017]|uniref:NADH-quinone oxidoreductase subunit N n=1 Tax=Paenibacillus sp. GSMTC-2017 TaxID=2794350 RepID=UPI0018D6278E|nr:NADH-quinone oxidoreductase subunit N [Paenibacillus sp. GSMTC-2017]MBH5320580.1 NADH-quinone oxidoreductase subunit N [Paenibacillus sp. GSMTC-2017]
MPGETIFKPLTWSDMLVMAPELALGAWFVLLIVLEMLLPQRIRRTWIGGLTLVGLLGAFTLVLLRMIDMQGDETVGIISLLGDSYRVDDFGNLMKLLFLGGTALVTLLGIGSVQNDRTITEKGEYFYLLIPAVIGAMIMASSGNLVTLYIGLELLSITSYVLVGLRRKSSLSAEAAFKYVVTGGISSAFILFGMSYVYGVTGAVDFTGIRAALPMALENYESLLYVGFAFMLAGFAIKIAAAPFHAWSLDVYQGAPTSIAAFLAVVSKGATLAIIIRIMFESVLFAESPADAASGLISVSDDIFFAVLLIAATAMLVGTIAALRQMNVKRLLALSGVANGGYLLVPVGISFTFGHINNINEILFYLVAYLLMTIGAFAIHTVVSRAVGHDELSGFAGMYYRAPWTAVAMTIFVLSLAGLPISAGFFGKLFILLGAAQAKAYWIVVIMVLSSVISYYFYFGLIRQMFMRSSNGVSLSASLRSGINEELGQNPHDGSEVNKGASAQGHDSEETFTINNVSRTVNEEVETETTVKSVNETVATGIIKIPVTIGIVIWFCASLTLAVGLFPGLLSTLIDFLFSIESFLTNIQ